MATFSNASETAAWSPSYIRTVLLRLTLVFVLSRLVIVLVGFIACDQFQSKGLSLEEMWSRFDVLWYRFIGYHGYEKLPFSTETERNWAFLPLYPISVKALLYPLKVRNFFYMASLLSNLLTFSALFTFFLVFKERIQNLYRFLFVYLAAAGSFYFSIPYSESMALFLIACTFYLTQRKNYVFAAFVAGLGLLSRIQLLALICIPLIPLFMEEKKKVSHIVAAVALFFLPFLIHMGYLNHICGNPWAFFDMQITWGNPDPYPLESLVRFILRGNGNDPCQWLHFFMWALFSACLIRNYKKIPLNEIVFCIAVFLISTGCERFYGAYRYVLTLVPLFIAFANEDDWFYYFYIYSNLIVGIIYIIAFVNNNGFIV